MSAMKSEKKGGIKTKIICKYFIQGKCTKGDSCPYLHSKVEKPKDIIQTECPMYNIGFCKNGRNCHFLHIKKDKYEEEKLEDKIKDSNIPMEEEKNETNVQNKEEEEKADNNIPNKDGEINKDKLENKEVEKNEIILSNEDGAKKDEHLEKKEEEKKYPEIPIWFLEHYFDKPIPLIFSELEQKNLPEITELKKKYGFTNIQPNLPIFPVLNKKNKMNLNMNTLNLNFNNFNMNFAFNNNKADINNKANNNIIQNSFNVNKINIGQNSSDKKYDKYESKKNSIEFLLNKQENIFYYLIRCKNYKEVEQSQTSNTISLPLSLYEKYKNIDFQKMTIIIIICEEEFNNFSGFAKLKTPLITDKKEEGTSFNIEWLWRTKLSLSKVNHLMNKADNDNFLTEGKNGCEIDKDLGFFCCRYMMKRLSKEEINELTSEKKMFESEKKLLQLQNLNNERYNQINSSINHVNKVNNSNKDLNYVHKKYENNDINPYYNNSNKKSDKSNTNSTKYSEHKHDKNKDYLEHKDYRDHKEQKFTGNKRHRNYSRSRSRSNNRRDNSEDYSNDYKHKRTKYQEHDKYYKFNYNNRNGNSYYNNSNNKNYSNQRSNNYQKENNLRLKNKYNENKGDYSNKKYYK